MPKNQVIGLQTLRLHGKAVSNPVLSRPRENIFTEDEWNFLRGLDTQELLRRYQQGANLISLIKNPSILNLRREDVDKIISNLRYQMDAIMSIIRQKKDNTEE